MVPWYLAPLGHSFLPFFKISVDSVLCFMVHLAQKRQTRQQKQHDKNKKPGKPPQLMKGDSDKCFNSI